jgi:hypothetical protein
MHGLATHTPLKLEKAPSEQVTLIEPEAEYPAAQDNTQDDPEEKPPEQEPTSTWLLPISVGSCGQAAGTHRPTNAE